MNKYYSKRGALRPSEIGRFLMEDGFFPGQKGPEKERKKGNVWYCIICDIEAPMKIEEDAAHPLCPKCRAQMHLLKNC